MNRKTRFSSGYLASGLALLAMLFVAVAGQAQETTSAIRGVVLGPDGSPAPNASVRIVDTRTGSGRTVSTNASGVFAAAGLRVGGPYALTVESAAYTKKTVNDVYLELGDTFNLTVPLSSEQIEEIFVTAAAVQTAQTALGPSSAFSLNDLQSAPAINRDIKDLIRIDPRIYVDEAFVDAIQCAGANPRFNSLTVDGVRLNDNFGLNSNGYPTERIPFSYDAIEQIAVELAPFDVQYGGFTACNINAVTKSGTNEFHGTAFVDYTDDGLRGDSLEGDNINNGDFDETRYGVSIGGPIMKDRLWFFAAYEKLEGANTFDRGPAGSGAAREIDGVSQAQYDEILDIAQNIYQYDPGGLPAAIDNEDEKLLVKLDVAINDNHRAAFTYNYNDGFNISQSDGDDNELEFSNHYYERGAELDSYTGQLFSNWTDAFSTEFRYSYTELDNRQLSLAGVDFGEVQITTFNDADNDGVDSRATVYLGADDSRHANKLKYDLTSYKLAGSYIMGDHTISGGFEREEFDVFNMFIQEAEGEFRFSSIDDFRNGTPNRVTYENASPSNVKTDAAATFQYEINSLYLQDEFTWPNSDVTIVAGLRYDEYTSDDVPRNNPAFEQTYGFSNSRNFDGESLLQPRLGINWEPTDNLNVRGGVGLYSGGNPNVWLSNNYSNDGVTQIEVQERGLDDGDDTLFTIPNTGDGRPIWNVPQELFDAVAAGSGRTGGINSLNESLDIPSEWKYALGATYSFDLPGGLGDGYTLNADVLISDAQDSAIIVDGSRTQVGTAPDGRPIYSGIVNTGNSDPVCQADPNSDNCGRRSQDFLLSNASDDGFSHSYSLALSKSYDWGLDWTLGYAYTESSDISPMTSSVAFSNYANIAVSDPNNPGRAQSNYEIPNRITLRLNYERAFWGDNRTKITLFGTANEGRPYTYVFTDGFMFGDSVGFISRHLLYVPTGRNDPNVNFNFPDPAIEAAFFDFLGDSGLGEFGGEIVPRNAFHSDWWTKFDLRVEQEFPGFADGHKISTFLLIENLGNLLNDDWGVLKEASFPRTQVVVAANIDDDGVYSYNNFFEPPGQGRDTDASQWELRFGFKYDF